MGSVMRSIIQNLIRYHVFIVNIITYAKKSIDLCSLKIISFFRYYTFLKMLWILIFLSIHIFLWCDRRLAIYNLLKNKIPKISVILSKKSATPHYWLSRAAIAIIVCKTNRNWLIKVEIFFSLLNLNQNLLYNIPLD